MKLRKTIEGGYTLKEKDEKGRETKDAHYKFVKIRDVRPRDVREKLEKS